MIQLVMYRIAEGQEPLLRWWMGELMRRRDEVVQTFEYEGRPPTCCARAKGRC